MMRTTQSYTNQLFLYRNCIFLRSIDQPYSQSFLIQFSPFKCIKQIQKIPDELKRIGFMTVYGIVQMEVNPYLVIVEQASLVGSIKNNRIFRAQKFNYIPLAEKQDGRDRQYLNCLRELFNTNYWYYSNKYDLTCSYQQFSTKTSQLQGNRTEFMFNHCWMDLFRSQKLEEWITVFINGFISIDSVLLKDNVTCTLVLITRMNTQRFGRKWILRGADQEGNTANTAQTEIIMFYQSKEEQHHFAYVQLRGSMPFIWEQYPDLKPMPTVKIYYNDEMNKTTMKKNYQIIERNYHGCTILNLVSKKKKKQQYELGQYFRKIHNLLQTDYNFQWLDFKEESRKLKLGESSQLTRIVSQQLEKYGYFQYSNNKIQHTSLQRMQRGIYRSNCLNSLDRTNVIQSFIAKYILSVWFQSLSVNKLNEQKSDTIPLQVISIVSRQWTDNAHAIAFINAGTFALKTQDSSSRGKSTLFGTVKDIWQRVKRRYIGNFVDPKLQDSIDFSLSKLRPKEKEQHRIRYPMISALWVFISILLLTMFIFAEPLSSLVLGRNTSYFLRVPLGLMGLLLAYVLSQRCHNLIVRRPLLASNVCCVKLKDE